MIAPAPLVSATGIEHRDLLLGDLAARVGDELDTLAKLSSEVQRAISLCHFADHTDAEAIRGLQGIDRITQALEDLGRLMVAVSTELPEDVKLHAVPILSRLRLHELANNLDPQQDRLIASNQEIGDIQWF